MDHQAKIFPGQLAVQQQAQMYAIDLSMCSENSIKEIVNSLTGKYWKYIGKVKKKTT